MADAIVKSNGAASAHEVDVTDTRSGEGADGGDRRGAWPARRAGQQCRRRRALRLPPSLRRGVGPRVERQSRRHGALRARGLRSAQGLGQGVGDQSLLDHGDQAHAPDGGLFGDQGGGVGAVAEPRRRVRALRHPREHAAAGLCRDGADRALHLQSDDRQGAADADAAQALRHAAGHRQRGAVPRLRRGRLHHRRQPSMSMAAWPPRFTGASFESA